MEIKQFKCKKSQTAAGAVSQFASMGAGAADLFRAAELSEKMIRDDNCVNFLSFSGAAVPLGLKGCILEFVERKWCDVIVTNGANIVHDMIDSFGGKHMSGSFCENDKSLHKRNIGRIGNVLIGADAYELFEKKIQAMYKEIYAEKQTMSIRELMSELGKRMPKGSILREAYDRDIPIYSPGFQDSMVGLQLLMFNQGRKLVIDATGDMHELNDKVMDSKHAGALILGGGVPKHYTLGSNILRGGLTYAVNITTGEERDASLSGAPLSEGKSWGKAHEEADIATVRGDYSICFPLITSYLIDRGL